MKHSALRRIKRLLVAIEEELTAAAKYDEAHDAVNPLQLAERSLRLLANDLRVPQEHQNSIYRLSRRYEDFEGRIVVYRADDRKVIAEVELDLEEEMELDEAMTIGEEILIELRDLERKRS